MNGISISNKMGLIMESVENCSTEVVEAMFAVMVGQITVSDVNKAVEAASKPVEKAVDKTPDKVVDKKKPNNKADEVEGAGLGVVAP